MRLVQLENDLVEQQEIQEDLEAERAELQEQVIRLELKCKGKGHGVRSLRHNLTPVVGGLSLSLSLSLLND